MRMILLGLKKELEKEARQAVPVDPSRSTRPRQAVPVDPSRSTPVDPVDRLVRSRSLACSSWRARPAIQKSKEGVVGTDFRDGFS